MGKVIQLASYRKASRKDYLTKHGGRLDTFLEKFVRHNIDIDYQQVAYDYQQSQSGSDMAWDYVAFRDMLEEAFDEAFGNLLYQLLNAQHWFDERLISRSEIIERCLSKYIMSNCHYAISL